MVSTKTVIRNPMGMHMRPAGMFANAMMKFDSDVNLVANGKTVNAKSIMNLIAACIKCGGSAVQRPRRGGRPAGGRAPDRKRPGRVTTKKGRRGSTC